MPRLQSSAAICGPLPTPPDGAGSCSSCSINDAHCRMTCIRCSSSGTGSSGDGLLVSAGWG